MELFRHAGTRLVICAAILAAALGLRLLKPEWTRRAAETLAPVLYESVDLREMAETLGGALSGRAGADVVLAVFCPAV
ncbi:MAG: hypothetical protein IKX41_04455 [Oscillospiraceae bacterium]|nr:hypothetical protein [Oscillospiraceae bacterium]